MAEIEINAQFGQVLEFINKTSRLVFLTGKAGTGKTTLLKYIKANTYKQMAVCAPTGVAAINAGGSTIHSLFQFPFTPFIPRVKENGDIDASAANLPALKYNSQRLSIFRNLELLVIDEISMVRADLLDQIDITLRYTRKKWHLPFGGVQLLLIGDMHQLSPVAQNEEWRILQQHYKSPYFFDSHIIRSHPPVYIELTKVYRQNDQRFIDLLNKVRHNTVDREAEALLNSCYRSDLSQADFAKNITLTTHNRKADEINASNLQALPGKLFSLKAEVKGLFPDKNYPAAEILQLKVGARVMFLKNNYEKNYYNGKTGIVTFLTEEKVRVKCEDDATETVVEREVWNNVSYKVQKSTQHIQEEILGAFSQFPLRPAWAITIHKSQGLTFDKVIIDAAEAFSAGQVYVALSRCRSLDGLTLSSRIVSDSLQNDRQILNFASSRQAENELGSILQQSRSGYVRSIIYDLFDFTLMTDSRKDLAALLQLHGAKLEGATKTWAMDLVTRLDNLVVVDLKFRVQLKNLAEQALDPENNSALQDRISKAARYFLKECTDLYLFLKNCGMSVESREAASDFNDLLQPLCESLFLKKALFGACEDGFKFDSFLKVKLKIEYPATKINVYASATNSKAIGGVVHPGLYHDLLFLRDEICNDEHKPIYLVANAKTLTELANRLPTTADQLLSITGFGEAKVQAYGDLFLQVIKAYCEQNDISTEFNFEGPEHKKKKKDTSGQSVRDKISTREKSMQLFRQGLTPEQIAQERALTPGTILSHLVPYVLSGEIEVNRLVTEKKQALIVDALAHSQPEQGLGHLKSLLPDDITYGEIRFVQAYRQHLAESSVERSSR